MRTNADLIAELEREAPNFTYLALAVGFENHTEYVFAGDKSKAKKLANLMQKGGDPIGLLGIQLKGKSMTVKCRVLEEYEDEPWANEYLESQANDVIQLAQSSGAA